jgi:hypothetical protein
MPAYEPQVSLAVEAIGSFGENDELAEAHVCEEGLIIEGYFADSTGLTWKSLARVLEHPYVQEKLEEVFLEEGVS